ncbi:MAG: hypothetical protein PHT62_11270 [Desulfotomaculaceae bacterium]|nr:hypothetical protein [Desulfotomaculaceae bacterium]
MEDLSPEEIWHWYNKRCNIENKIDELKTGVSIDQTSQNELSRNMALHHAFQKVEPLILEFDFR